MRKPLGKEINELGRDIRKIFNYHLEGYSLGDGQFSILYEVFFNPGISQEKLSKKRNVDKTTIAKAVKKLINNGYIEKNKDKMDKRVYCLLCTEKAAQLIPEIKRVIKLENKVITEGFSEDEIKVFRKMMEKITKKIDKHLKKMGE
jgi:DNA-binding MarR family transcriptional regulator